MESVQTLRCFPWGNSLNSTGSSIDFLFVSLFENTPNLAGKGPKQPAPVGSALTKGLD